MKKLRYKLHWNSNPQIPNFKWVIYDWKYRTPIMFAETRVMGRIFCNALNNFQGNIKWTS